MATLSEVCLELVTRIAAEMTANEINAMVGSEWPSTQDRFDAGLDGAPAVIAVIHKLSNFKKGNMSFVHSETSEEPSLASTLSDTSLQPGGTITLGISLAEDFDEASEADLISFILSDADDGYGVTYVVEAGQNLVDIAEGLASAINDLDGMTAELVDGGITVTNGSSQAYTVSSNTGVTASRKRAVKWAIRSMQANVWCGDQPVKFQIQNVLEQLFVTLDDDEGFYLPSGEHVDFDYLRATPNDQDVDKDVFTDFHLFTVVNIVDKREDLYSVVAIDSAVSLDTNIASY